MTQLERAVESTGALVLARIIAPAVMTIGLGVGAWIGNAVYGELKALRADVTNVLIEQRGQGVQIDEHERRLNRLEGTPRSQQQNYVRPDDYRPVK